MKKTKDENDRLQLLCRHIFTHVAFVRVCNNIAQAGKFLGDSAKKFMPFLSSSWLCFRYSFFFLFHSMTFLRTNVFCSLRSLYGNFMRSAQMHRRNRVILMKLKSFRFAFVFVAACAPCGKCRLFLCSRTCVCHRMQLHQVHGVFTMVYCFNAYLIAGCRHRFFVCLFASAHLAEVEYSFSLCSTLSWSMIQTVRQSHALCALMSFVYVFLVFQPMCGHYMIQLR